MSTSLLAQTLAKLGELATSLGTALTNIAGVQATANTIRTDVTSARDIVNTTTNNARDNVKAHVTAAVGAISSSAIKNVYTVFPTARTVAGNGGTGGIAYADIPIAAVNTAKALILGVRTVYGSSAVSYLTYRFINATTVRAEASYGSGLGGGVDIVWGFTVVEFN